jgi:hypothetical protein
MSSSMSQGLTTARVSSPTSQPSSKFQRGRWRISIGGGNTAESAAMAPTKRPVSKGSRKP